MPDAKKIFWKNWIVLLLGFVVLLLPFLGFPARLNYWLFAIAGVCIIVLSFLIGRALSALYSAPQQEQLPPRRQPQRVSRPRSPRPRNASPFLEASLAQTIPPANEADEVAFDHTVVRETPAFSEIETPSKQPSSLPEE